MAGAQDVQARRPGLTIGFLSLLVIGQADFHIPNMMQVGPVATTTCGVCGTVTPSPGLGPESMRARAKAAAGVAPADGPGPNFQQYQGPRQRTSSDATNDAIFGPTTPAPHSPMGFLHMDKKKLNIPMIAGLATGGAVVAAGVITATVAGVKSHQKQMEKKAKQAQAESGSAPAIQASQGPALAPPHPLPSTFLTKAVLKGDTVIEVASVQGFAIGDTVKIGNLFNTVKGFGSLTLDHPMQHNVQSGAEVQVIREPASVINARVLITTTLDQGQLNMVLGGANPAANQFSARTVVGPTTAPPAGNNTSAMTAFYCVLAGILLCCVFWCLVAAVGIFMNKSKKNRGRDVGKSDYSEVSDEEEDEAEDEEEEEVPELPSDEEKKEEEQEEEEELDDDEEEEQDDVEEGRRKIRPT